MIVIENESYSLNVSGNIRRFRRVCEHIQSQVCSRRPPPSPRATRKFTTELSESSSCGSDTSERLSPHPGTRQSDIDFDCSVFDAKSPTKESIHDRQQNIPQQFLRRNSSTSNNNNNHHHNMGKDCSATTDMSQSQQLRSSSQTEKNIAVRSHSETKTDGLEALEKCRVTTTSESIA